MDLENAILNSNEIQNEQYIGEEERIRHDALFYSQNPEDGLLLSGERARSLFIKSKLPLQDLSKIWKLADVTRDNMLDESEFAVAVHLIQRRLCGFAIPDSIQNSWRPEPRPLLVIKQIDDEELGAYGTVFDWLLPEDNGRQNSEIVLKFLGTSGLSAEVLANIWDLSDVDRDGRINKEEFFIALHLTRFCSNNQSDLEGSVDVVSMLPKKASGESIQEKRRRRTEYQTEIRKLRSLKDKLQSELINAESNKNEAAKAKIQYELDKTKSELESVIKREATVGKEITQLNLQTSVTTNIEVLRPFDRSFLMKRQSCGIDFLKKIQYREGQCTFCEGVAIEIFIAKNIFDFVSSLPVNPYATAKRRGSKSQQKDSKTDNVYNTSPERIICTNESHENSQSLDKLLKSVSNTDSQSSDDESDSGDIGIRRKKRNKTRSERNKKEPASQKRIRSLSEAINDIEARNKAAKEEMDKKMIRSQSESGNSTEGTSTDTSNEDKIAKRKEAYKRRSKSAMEMFQKLFSSDSETASDGGSATRKRSLKNLQKTPWSESKETKIKSSSESEGRQSKADEKVKANRKGSKDLGRKNQSLTANGSLLRDERDLVISVVKNEENEFDFQARLDNLDKDTPFSSNTDDKSIKNRKEIKTNVETSTATNKVSRSSGENTTYQKDGVTVIEELSLRPATVNGFYENEGEKGIVNRKQPVKEIEEEVVSQAHVPLDERVRSLIDLLEETSCDSIEEENFRRKLSEPKEAKFINSEIPGKSSKKSIDSGSGSDSDVNKRNGKMIGYQNVLLNKNSNNTRNSLHTKSNTDSSGSSSRTAPHSDADRLDGGSRLHSHSENDISDGGSVTKIASTKLNNLDSPDLKVKKRKVLKTKSGHVVRSKSVHGVRGLRNLLDPDKLSFVEECEWLDTLVQAELETIERRKLEEASQSPKTGRNERPQLFTRSETIDETSLNLTDSRKLVKNLLDMEIELRKEKELSVTRRDDKRERDANFLERRKSMPVGEEALRDAEAKIFATKEFEVESKSPSAVSDESQVAIKEQRRTEEKDKSALEDSTAKNAVEVQSTRGKGASHVTLNNDINQARVEPNKATSIHGHETKERPNSEVNHEASTTKHAADKTVTKTTEIISSNDKNSTLQNIKSEIAAVKELHRQPSFEEHRHLKNIKTFKEIFEEKSAPVRPVDSYHKSLSMDVKPSSLGRLRSKSFGEGLNRPSEESAHIHVFEKQPSVEKKTNRRDSGDKGRNVIYYEEAKIDAARKKSREENKIKSSVINADEGSRHEMSEHEKHSSFEEDVIPTFKKVGDFKQLFEGESKMEAPLKKKVIVAKKSEPKQEEQSVQIKDNNKEMTTNLKDGEKLRPLNEKSNIENKKSEIVETRKHQETSPEFDKSKEGTGKLQANSEEENIPSIKDRLMLFQTNSVEGDGVQRRGKEIRKIRPKSFHGGIAHMKNVDSDEASRSPTTPVEVESQLSRSVGQTETPKGQRIRNLGELMMERPPESKYKKEAELQSGSPKQVLRHGSKVENKANSTSQLEHTRDSTRLGEKVADKDKAVEEFSYMKVVKDDRIRRELEEQEAREAEMRTRLKSNGSDIVDEGKTISELATEDVAKTVNGLKKEDDSSIKEANHEDGSENTPLKRRVQNERLRKEMEEERQRDEELQSRKIVNNTKLNKKTDNMIEDKVKKEQHMKDSNKAINLQINLTDKNDNVLSLHTKPNVSLSREERDSLKSRKLPSKIELELEEERRRELELEEERKRREIENNKILEEQRRKTLAVEAEQKRIEEEELAKQNAVLEEKMKRQERTRGLRALFETS